jgi:hypothetical protein
MGRRALVLVLWMLLIGFLIAVGLVAALGRDLDGRYAESLLKRWFDQLESGWGRCCSDADGRIVEDADWEAKDGHYRVRVPNAPGSKDMLWVGVPNRSVVTEPNRAGRTMVRPVYVDGYQGDGFYQGEWIRCFMPGSMT